MSQFATDPAAAQAQAQSLDVRVAYAANNPDRVRYTIDEGCAHLVVL